DGVVDAPRHSAGERAIAAARAEHVPGRRLHRTVTPAAGPDAGGSGGRGPARGTGEAGPTGPDEARRRRLPPRRPLPRPAPGRGPEPADRAAARADRPGNPADRGAAQLGPDARPRLRRRPGLP